MGVAVALLWTLVLRAGAQATTADVLGTVSDPSGAVVPGASVILANLGTNETQETKSTADGQYIFNLVKPGQYSVSISAVGYSTVKIAGFTVQAGDRAREDAHLPVGAAQETVTVTAAAPALQSDSSVLSSTITAKAVQDLPLNGRNFINLAQLVPGASEGTNNALASGNRPDDRRQTSAISVNGQTDAINDELIDGLDNNERIIGSIGVRPSVESIQEVNVQTNSYTAAVGRTAGGVVNVITRSGNNRFSGSVYEFFRNTDLDAYPFAFGLKTPKPPLHQNQFGASLGGPIRKDRTFFFFDYEGLRLTRSNNPITSTVPTAYEETHIGDFSDNPNLNVVLTPGQIDQAGLSYFKLYPTPNQSGFTNNYVATQTLTQNSSTYDARVDHRFNDANMLYGRYTYNGVTSNLGGLFPAVQEDGLTIQPTGNFASYPGPSVNDARNAALDYTHIFSPTFLIEAQAGYTFIYNSTFTLNYGQAVNSAFGQPNVNIDASSSGLAPLNITSAQNLGDATSVPVQYDENTFQYQTVATLTRGKHNIKIGATSIRRQATVDQSNFVKGQWTVTTLPQLLQGNFTSLTQQRTLVVPHYRSWEPSGFVQDDWHIADGLTLNIGVRYDLFTPFTEVKNQISNFDPTTARIIVANVNGTSKNAGIRTDYSNFAPRFGFAATVLPQTVVRGGFALSFTPENVTAGASLKNQPFAYTFGPCSPTTCPGGIAKMSQGLPFPTPPDYTNPTGAIPASEELGFRSTYIEQFNLTAEREFANNVFGITYVGELGRHIGNSIADLNAPPPNTAANPNTLRPFYAALPNVTTIRYWNSHGASSYHSLQAKFERRTRNGLTYSVNYTWAHGLDDAPDVSANDSSGYANVPSQIAVLDYGNSDLDLRNRFVGTVNYEIPFGKNLRGIAAAFGKGWQTNLLLVLSSGHPFTVLNASNRNGTRPGVAASDRPNEVSTQTTGSKALTAWFNTAAFAAQPLGTLGSERRNQLYGPGYRHLDASLFKTFPLYRETNLQFRAEAFNVSNTSNFANPNANLGVANFGTVSATANSYQPRLYQLALKLQF